MNDETTTIGSDDLPYPKDKEEFFEDAWGELDKTVTRQDAVELIYFFGNVTEFGGVLREMSFDVFLDNVLDILRHPERDDADLNIAAPATPTWEWFCRLLLAAMEKSVPQEE